MEPKSLNWQYMDPLGEGLNIGEHVVESISHPFCIEGLKGKYRPMKFEYPICTTPLHNFLHSGRCSLRTWLSKGDRP